MDRDIEKELGRAVTLMNTEKKEKRELKTFVDVLKYQLDEIIDRGDVGYSQEILLPVPEDMVNEGNEDANKILKLSGRVNRNKDLPVGVSINTEEVKGREKTFNMINITYVIKGVSEAEALRGYIQKLSKK